MHTLASPARFVRFTDRWLFWIATLTAAMLGYGVVQALVFSPADYQQGDSVRIMYVHVPAAWMSLAIYTLMAVASASLLIWKHPLAGICARSAAPLGAAFTLVTLVTGALWGKPMWGAWWVWDARLTSVLILFFIYIAYIALANSYEGNQRGDKVCAVFALIGFVNIPIIRFSVEWWNTLHQPASVIRSGGIAIDDSMLAALLFMAAGFMGLFTVLLVMRMKTMLYRQKIRRLQFSSASHI
ncbi:MAG: heme ABC transporter permease [Alphaproteobacteria bacterium]